MPTQVIPQTHQAEQSVSSPAPPSRKHEPSVRQIIESARSAPARAIGAWTCSLTSALLMWASFAPLDFGWLAWLAPVPLILLIRIERPTRAMYPILYAAGLAWSLPTLQWMRLGDPAMYIAWVALAVYVALYIPVFVAVTRSAVHRFSVPLIVAVPLVWTGLEYLRATLMTGFAWYLLGHTQYAFPELIQISDVVGAYGVGFVVAMAAACVAGLVPSGWLNRLKLFPPVNVPKDFEHLPEDGLIVENSSRADFRRPWIHVAITLIVFSSVLAYGFVRRGQADFKDGPRVALIQGNFPTSMKHSKDDYPKIYRYHDALTGMAVRHQPDLIVWPETMFRWPLQIVEPGVDDAQLLSMAPPGEGAQQHRWVDSWSDPAVQQTFKEMAERAGASMMIGVDTWVAGEDRIRAYNSAAFVTPQQGIVDRYDKMHRVIFGEYVPLQDTMPWLQAFTPIPAEYGIQKGDAAVLMKHREWTLAPIICFEDTVPHLIRDIARGSGESVDVFVNLTNDGWFAGSSELDQHLITASFRAIETRTPMVRAVNTGISAVIDGDGVIREPEIFIDADAKTPDEARMTSRDPETGRWHKSLNAALVSNVPIDNRTSFYVRNGDWFAQSCCLGAVFFAFAGPFRRRKQNVDS